MNKYRVSSILVLTAACLLGSCGGGSGSREELTTFNASSRLFGTPKVNPDNPTQPLPELKENIYSAPLVTYHLNSKGDIPYVEASELASAINEATQGVIVKGMKAEVKDDLLYITSKDGKGEMVLDAKTDEVKLKSSPSFTLDITKYNNNVPGDYCFFRDNAVKDSPDTKQYKEDGSAISEYETFSFKDYGFDIYQKEGKYYVPFEAVTKLLFRDVGVDFAFNGKDFYINSLGAFIQTRAYSSNGYFKNYNGIYAPSKEKGEGEAYRFQYSFQTDIGTATNFYILKNDGTGAFVSCDGTTLDYNKRRESPDANYSYTWTKDGDLLYLKIVDNDTPLGEYQIHLDETNFLKGTSSKEMADYNYNILRFLFDHIYGLKGIKGYKDAESYFTSIGVKDGLKSTDITTYNGALSKLLGKADDGHTAHTGLSLLTKYEETDGLPELSKKNADERLKALVANKQRNSKARVDKFKELNPDDPNAGNTDPNFYQGMRFSSDKKTAVITFDGFLHGADTVKNMKELFPTEQSYEEQDYLIRSRPAFISSTPDGFSTCFDMLKSINKTSKVVENVVFDLTNNGGGMIATLPYIEAFISDDPTYVLKDTNTGVIKEYHYKVDLNGDGTFGGAGDTFKGQFNFYFLTSGFSFSCGNYLPGFAKNAGCKIIGERSGGGVSPVGVFLDALGSGLQLSNYTNMLYKDANGKYIHNDGGIPVDYEFKLDKGNWYDPNAVDAFIKTLK